MALLKLFFNNSYFAISFIAINFYYSVILQKKKIFLKKMQIKLFKNLNIIFLKLINQFFHKFKYMTLKD